MEGKGCDLFRACSLPHAALLDHVPAELCLPSQQLYTLYPILRVESFFSLAVLELLFNKHAEMEQYVVPLLEGKGCFCVNTVGMSSVLQQTNKLFTTGVCTSQKCKHAWLLWLLKHISREKAK